MTAAEFGLLTLTVYSVVTSIVTANLEDKLVDFDVNKLN
jgi:hypothetical protein